MVFLDAPCANFDLSSLSFQAPIRGLAAKVAAVAVNNSASATSEVRFFLIARFRALSPRGVKSKQRRNLTPDAAPRPFSPLLPNYFDRRPLKSYNFVGFSVSNLVNPLHAYEYEIISRLLYGPDGGNVDRHGRVAPWKFRRRFRS